MTTEQIPLEATSRLFKDKTVVWNNQHEFIKRKLCLKKLTSFHDEFTCLVDKRKAVDVADLDFDKSYRMVFISCQ